MSIHDKVKAVRKKLGLSQTAFGERLGVGIGVIKNIEYAYVDPKEPFLTLLCEVVEEFLNGCPIIAVEFGECENEAFADACVIIVKK